MGKRGSIVRTFEDRSDNQQIVGTPKRAPAFRSTTDLHHHLDAMTPSGILAVSNKHNLTLAGKTIDEIAKISQAKPGSSWNDWYKVHCDARKAVFVRPEVFFDVAIAAIRDAEEEGLEIRVFRFSLSMAQYCFIAEANRKPDLNSNVDKKRFLEIFDQIIENLSLGIQAAKGKVKTPLIFSFSSQDEFIPLLQDIASVVLNHKSSIVGIDLTNEQIHRLATEYTEVIEIIRNGGIEALTIHTGEQEIPHGKTQDERGRMLQTAAQRIRAALALKPNSLGHAIYASGDTGLVTQIQRSGVIVELCPSSNIYLNDGFVNDKMPGNNLKKYPLLEFMNAGILCTINSDVPGSIASTLAKEFELIRRIFMMPRNSRTLRQLDDNARKFAKEVYKVKIED